MMASVSGLAAAGSSKSRKSVVLLFSALLFLFDINDVLVAIVHDRVTLLAIESSMIEKDTSSSCTLCSRRLDLRLASLMTPSWGHIDHGGREGKEQAVLEVWSGS